MPKTINRQYSTRYGPLVDSNDGKVYLSLAGSPTPNTHLPPPNPRYAREYPASHIHIRMPHPTPDQHPRFLQMPVLYQGQPEYHPSTIPARVDSFRQSFNVRYKSVNTSPHCEKVRHSFKDCHSPSARSSTRHISNEYAPNERSTPLPIIHPSPRDRTPVNSKQNSSQNSSGECITPTHANNPLHNPFSANFRFNKQTTDEIRYSRINGNPLSKQFVKPKRKSRSKRNAEEHDSDSSSEEPTETGSHFVASARYAGTGKARPITDHPVNQENAPEKSRGQLIGRAKTMVCANSGDRSRNGFSEFEDDRLYGCERFSGHSQREEKEAGGRGRLFYEISENRSKAMKARNAFVETVDSEPWRWSSLSPQYFSSVQSEDESDYQEPSQYHRSSKRRTLAEDRIEQARNHARKEIRKQQFENKSGEQGKRTQERILID